MPTKIEWCEETWNPVTGCTKISAGCKNCYAERMAKRLAGRVGYPQDEPFKVTLHDDRLEEPLKWKKPRRVFVCSMGDLFHDDVPFHFIDEVFARMAIAKNCTFIVLTKRPKRMQEYFWNIGGTTRRDWVASRICRALDTTTVPHFEWPLPNVWLGVTAENKAAADERIPVLLKIPAAVRFVSIEPMLGPVDLTTIKWARISVNKNDYKRYGVPAPDEIWSTNNVLESRPGDELNPPKIGLDWVICGGESGPSARPMHPDWARKVRDDCKAAGVPFFFKQWGEWEEWNEVNAHKYQRKGQVVWIDGDGNTISLDDDGDPAGSFDMTMIRTGKKAAGRRQ